MSITTGITLITCLTFIISMIVATLIWILMKFNDIKVLIRSIKREVLHFLIFQRLYRNYWNNINAPTNELITFFHGK